MKKNTYLVVIFSLVMVLGVSACSLSLAQDVTPPPGYQAPVYEEPELVSGAFPQQKPDLANGAAIYVEKCLPCHGDTGLGDGPESTGLPVDVARIGDANVADPSAPLEWYTIVLQGNIERFMPPFSGSLNEQDVWDVVSYVYSINTQESAVSEGAALYSETCAACHGTEVAGPVAPGAFDFRDAEQMVVFSMDDFIQKIATGNGNPDHVFSTILDLDQQKALAYYLRSLTLPVGQPEETALGGSEEPAAEPPAEEEPAEEGPVPAEDPAAEPPVNQDDGLGQVTGMVINGSGGDLPEGLEVTLEVYQSFEVMYSNTVPANLDGSFVFVDVVIDPELIYITLVELDGTYFPSDFQMGNEILGDSIELPITIYDVTSDPSELAVSRLHVFFQFTDQDTVQVIHQVSLSNFGNKMVAPENGSQPVLNFSLPEGATNLIFQTGAIGNPYTKTAAGFGDPSPVLPGSNSYDGLFAYDMPYDGKLIWALPIDLPTDVAVIFVQGEDVKVESKTLLPSGTEALDQEVYQVLVANAISDGKEIDLQISTGFGGLGNLNLDGGLLTIVLGVVGLGLAGFGVWRFFPPVDEHDLDDEDGSTADALMDEIVELDEAFVAGEVDEADFHARREALKDDLKMLLDQEEAE